VSVFLTCAKHFSFHQALNNDNDGEVIEQSIEERMSATSKVTTENISMAHVNFRVRCEQLGHGEAVYLVQEGDSKMQKVSCGWPLP
jgi:hypothetical protein